MINASGAVHMGAKSGREQVRRLGYGQIANALYLTRKGSLPLRLTAPPMLRQLAANLLRAAASEAHIDRRGRLLGNLLAMGDFLHGIVEPERAIRL
jgi:hypothetical protein